MTERRRSIRQNDSAKKAEDYLGEIGYNVSVSVKIEYRKGM
jgi:hypothetical protein